MTASQQVRQVLDIVRRGDRPRAVQLTVLADLPAADAAALQEVWPALGPASRRDLLVRATELLEDNVDLNFTALARVALGDSEPEIRQRAIEALWESRERGVALQLARVLRGDAEESVRASAASALEPFVVARELEEFDEGDGDAVVEALRTAIADPAESVDVRSRSLESLGARTLRWVETLINDAYFGDDERLRIAAIRAMGLSAQERWLEYLDDLVTSDEPLMRFEAASAMGAIGSEDSVDPLTELLADEDDEVVAAAVGALGLIGGEDVISRLRRFAEHTEGALSDAVQDALDVALYLEDPDMLASRIGL